MSKAKRKHLIASLLMLSLGSCPVLAKTVPATPIDGNASGAAIFVTGSSSTEQKISFDLTPYDGEISGWNGIYGGIVNMYSGKNITVTGAIQSYTNNKSGTAAGSSPSVGGAIANMANSANETFTLSGNEIAFANNSSDRGGAIYNETGAFVFNADTISFDGNTAVNSGTWQGGGAILNIDGNVSVKEGATLSFTGNTTNGTDTNASHGGAIYNGSFLEGYTGTVDLSNAAKVTFTGNEATGAVSSGGAIMNENGSVKLGDNVVFQKNEAANSGGAVMNTTGVANVAGQAKPAATFSIGKNATFEENTAGSGAAIYNQRGTTNVGSDAKFYSNKATSYAGGAIYSETVTGYPQSVVNIGERAEFIGNKSETSHGGAIFQFISNADDTTSNINIASGALFKNNESEKTGGAIANWGGDLTVDNATFTGNKANTSGGAIYNDTYENTNGISTVTINGDTTFSGNIAVNGGAIANSDSSGAGSEVVVSGATFDTNTANGNGGAIYNNSVADFTDSKFTGNTSGTFGGAIMSTEGSDLTITNGTFTENRVTGDVKASYGGAIFNQGKMEVSGTFSGNEAGRGGAIYNYATAETTIGAGSVFENNKSTYGHGSAIYTFSGMTIEDNVQFKNNHANWGGALAVELTGTASMPAPTNTTVEIGKNVLFENNTSGAGGAAIVNTNGNITIADNAQFIGNESGAGGGAIYNTKDNANGVDSAITLGSATFSGNSTTGNGGAIYNDDKSTVTITGKTTFSGNNATGKGGAISNAADSVIALDTTTGNITFTGNTTGAEGAKVLNDINTDGTVNITGDVNTVSVNTITGSDTGVINKTGGNILALNDNNSGFKGDFTQSKGITQVFKEFFGGDSKVETSSVDMKDGSSVVKGSTVTLGTDGKMNVDSGAKVKIDGTVSATENGATVNNDGNIEVNGSLIADVIQDTTDASITVNSGATLGTQNDDSAIANGRLDIKQGAIIDGVVAVTEAVVVDLNGQIVSYSDTGIGVGSGTIQNAVQGEALNLANAAIGVDDNGFDYDITLSNGSYLTPTGGTPDAPSKIISLGNGDNTKTPTITYSDDAVTNAEHTLNVNKDATLKLAPTKGNNFELNSKVTSADGEGQVFVDQIKVKNPNYVDDATTPDEEEFIEQGVGTITVNSDNSGFKGSFLQNMGNLILAAGSKFFGGQNKIDGGSVTVQKEAVLTGADDDATQVTGGALNLADGAILDKNVTVTTDDNSYGTVNLYNAIKGEVGEDGVTRISADSIANGNDGLLTYVNSDGSEKTINITNGAGLGLLNGVRVEGDELALQSDKGVRDLTFGNGSGSETNSIVLNENTKLTYRDGAYIKDDSTVDMKDGASLNLANNTTDVTYNPIISGTANSTINKTGNGSTVIASALDKFTGNVNVLGGALELATAEDKTFNNLNVQNADFHSVSNIGVEGAEGNGKVNIENSNFSVDKTLEAMAEVNIDGSNVNIAENLGGADTTITDSTVNVGKEMSTNDLNVTNSTLNVASNLYSDNTVLDAVNATIGGNLDAENLTAQNGTNLTVAGDVSAADSAFTDSTVNLNGKNSSFNSLIVNGSTLNNMTNMTVANDLIFGAGANGANSTLNMTNGTVNTITANNTVLNSDLNIAFDVDPSKGYAMDSIQTNTFTDNGNQLIVGGINFVSSPIDRNFAVDASKFINSGDGNVASFGESSFLANTHLGQYLMSTGAGGGSVIAGSLQSINPQMYRGQVATVASYMNQLVVNNMLFDHMEVITRQMMAQERTANKYSATEPLFAPYQYSAKDGTLWYKAYANFERLSMTQGLSVGNNAYGSLIGADFPLVELENGWKIIPTAYVAYNGAHQHFNGVSMYQNGGQIGAMGTAYKGDFLTSLLVYGGGYANDMNVNNAAFGSASDTTGNWFAGVASKTAYNFHVAKDFIVQPTALVSYNMFGNQNWHSNFGAMGMNAGFMNGINIAPGLNLILNKKTWSLYATVQYMYNIMGGVDGRAGNVTLDGVRMRHGYLEYGIGATKTFKDRLTSYFQITLRNVGRTGIGFQFGLNWKI